MHRLHLSALTQPRVAVKLGVTVAVLSTVAVNRDRLLQFRCVGANASVHTCACISAVSPCLLCPQAPAQQHSHRGDLRSSWGGCPGMHNRDPTAASDTQLVVCAACTTHG
jgi:hypothetical protein